MHGIVHALQGVGGVVVVAILPRFIQRVRKRIVAMSIGQHGGNQLKGGNHMVPEFSPSGYENNIPILVLMLSAFSLSLLMIL